MKIFKLLFVLLTVNIFCISCGDDDTPALAELVSNTFKNLHAPQSGGPGPQGNVPVSGEFTKFDFATKDTTNSATDWDIAFRGTNIIINGGESQGTTDEPERTGNAAAYIAEATFSEVTSVNTDSFVQDSKESLAIPSGGGNGWYNYDRSRNLISPFPGRVLVIRTRDGKYAKVEIQSYYKDAPGSPDATTDEARYYTFSYSYQPNKEVTTF